MVDVMALYLKHADTLRSPETAKFHAARSGRWLEGSRASHAREAVAAMVQDMAGVYQPSTINRTIGTIKKALTLAWDRGMTKDNHGLRIQARTRTRKSAT
jgi:pyruvate/oxaloacetate carboxyltransferase